MPGGSAKLRIRRQGGRVLGSEAHPDALRECGFEQTGRGPTKAAGAIKNVRLLGEERAVMWIQTNIALEIDLTGIETGESGFAIEVAF